MAIVKTISPKIKTQVHLSEALAYITKDEKASDCYYHNCVNDSDIDAVVEEFQSTRIMLRQDKGIIASHICQSFSPDDKVTPEIAHEIGKQMIERCFPNYQVVLATHKDREHIHNHFIINSVNLIDGKKFYENKSTVRLIRKVSDELCYRHNLSVIEKEDATKYSPLDQATLNAARQGRSWKFNLVKDLDAALDSCKTKSEFVRFFESKNYEIKFTPQNITFRKIGNKKGIRTILRCCCFCPDLCQSNGCQTILYEEVMKMQEKNYNPIEMRRHRDTDGDGIPDSADSRYTKPDDDYQYRRISESDYDRLRGAGLDNKVECKHDTKSAGTLIIRYQDSQAAEIDRVLRHAMHPVQKM